MAVINDATLANVIFWIIALAIVGLVLRFLYRRLGNAFLRSMVGTLPRFQQMHFVQALRERAAGNPDQLRAALEGNEARAFARALWRQARGQTQRDRLKLATVPDRGGEMSQFIGQQMQTASEPGPAADAQLDVVHRATENKDDIFVVCLPPSTISGEACFVAIVYPSPRFGKYLLEPNPEDVNFFILETYSGSGRDTELTGWTRGGEQRYYNCGAPRDPQGFAGLVESKLSQDRQRRIAKYLNAHGEIARDSIST